MIPGGRRFVAVPVARDLLLTSGCWGIDVANEQPIAVDFGIRSESVLVDWFPAYVRSARRHSSPFWQPASLG
jgi:hypothetical protein